MTDTMTARGVRPPHPLHARHVALGAKMAAFGGWEMPIEYAGGGVVAEHTAVRDAVGVFDVSHLGKAWCAARARRRSSTRRLTTDLGRIAPGQAQYTLCCDDETGGVVDDLIAYLRADDEVFLVPNAANTAEVVRAAGRGGAGRVSRSRPAPRVRRAGGPGPASDEVLGASGCRPGSTTCRSSRPSGAERPVVVCRTGYTGERGYELVPLWDDAAALWDALVEAARAAAGRPGSGRGTRCAPRWATRCTARSSRLDISPVQARVGWAVGWKKPSFWGRDALLAEKRPDRAGVLWGLLAPDRGVLRADLAVVDDGGSEVGETTSGTFSPTLRQGIALALLRPGRRRRRAGRRRPRPAAAVRVVKPPFVEVPTRQG